MGFGVVAGLNCKAYRNTGSHNSPTWNEITIVQDATLDLSKGKAEVKARYTLWQQNLPIFLMGPVTLKCLADSSVDDYDSLRDAYINNTIQDIALAEGPINTNTVEYFRADYIVFDFKRGEPLENAATVDIALDLAVSVNVPAFTTVGS